MNCRDATALIEKLVDGEASASERSLAEAHLEGCEACRAEKRFLERAAEAMKARAETASELAPPGYWESLPDRVLARIDAPDSDSGRGKLGRFYPLMALAASLLVAATVVLVVSREPGGRSLEMATAQSPAPAAEAIEEEAPPVSASASPPPPPPTPAPEPAREGTAGFAEAPLARRMEVPSAQRASVDVDTAEVEPSSKALSDELRSADDTVAVAGADAESGEAAAAETFVAARSDRALAERLEAGADTPRQPAEERARAVAPASPGSRLGRAPSSALSVRSPCEALRAELARLPEDAEAERTEKLYEIAQCSVQRFDAIGSEELRELAVSDVESFLAVEPESDRARELRAVLPRLQ